MKRVLTLVVIAAAAPAAGRTAQAQTLPPMDGVVLASDVVRGDDGRVEEYGLVEERPGLSQREISQMLLSRGFSPLSPPIRRGPAYVVAVIDPNGEDGRVTVDALSGRIVRFRPISGPNSGPSAMVLPDDVRGAYARRDLTPPNLTPPRNIPYVAARPAPRPAGQNSASQAATSKNAAGNTAPKIATRLPASSAAPQNPAASNPAAAMASVEKPAQQPAAAAPAPAKPAVELQATQPMPPVQGFE